MGEKIMKKLLSFLIAFTVALASQANPDSSLIRKNEESIRKFFVQLQRPKIDISNVYKTTLTVSWSNPPSATSFTVQRSTNSSFTSPTTIYTGGQQVFQDASLVENTVYYYRVKAEAAGFTDSDWSLTFLQKTFWTPNQTDALANPPGRSGNRFADATDKAYFGGNVNVGDYIIVGYTSGGSVDGEWGHGVSVDSRSLAAFTSDTNKIVIIGGRAYDYLVFNLANWAGSDTNHRRVITNSNGQAILQSLDLSNAVNFKITSKYDPNAKTGDANFVGSDNPNWDNLSESYGIYLRGNYVNGSQFGCHIQGNSSWVQVEYLEGGEGGYVALSVKNDGFPISNSSGTWQIFSVPNTGAGTYTTLTNSTIVIPYNSNVVRLFADYNGGGGANYKVNWIEFELQTSPFTVTRIQAEDFLGKLRASVIATGDVDGVSDIGGMVEGSAIDYSVTLPPGSYTVRARVTSTVTTGRLMLRLGSTTFDGLELRYCYFHDQRGGENIYTGSTQPDPQQLFTHLWIHHNIFIRSGLNAIQTGQMIGETNVVENNVGLLSSISWDNTFQRFQDQTTQQSSRSNGFKYRNNLLTGGGESFINFFMLKNSGYTSTLTTEFNNNAYLNLNGYLPAYMNTKEPGSTGTVKVYNNVWGRVGSTGKYPLLYGGAGTHPNFVVDFESSPDPTFTEDGSTAGNGTMRVGSNIYDTSIASGGTFGVKNGFSGNITLIDSGTNVRQNHVPYPKFNNLMDLDSTYDWASIEYFCTSLSPQWNRYNTFSTNALNSQADDTISIPTTHPTTVNITVYTEGNSGSGYFWAIEPSRSYTVGEYLVVKQDIYSPGKYFVGQVTSFNATTGALVLSSVSNVGTGDIPGGIVSGTPIGARISRARSYDLNQIVYWEKRYYKSLVSNNLAHEPSLNGDSNWKLLVFSNGSIKPVDDVRLPATDYYFQRNIGLGINPGQGFSQLPKTYITRPKNARINYINIH
jgi:hypothetical protein